jgi:hypothetical protein
MSVAKDPLVRMEGFSGTQTRRFLTPFDPKLCGPIPKDGLCSTCHAQLPTVKCWCGLIGLGIHTYDCAQLLTRCCVAEDLERMS